MKIINNDPKVTSGVYTRTEGGRSSIVDYGTIEHNAAHMVSTFIIDSDHRIAQGSDHSILIMELDIKEARIKNGKVADVVK